jgi:hypothetical protein
MTNQARQLPHVEGVLNADELRVLTGLDRDADIQRVLRKQGILCFPGKDGPWTTLELVNLAGRRQLGLEEDSGQSML